MPGPFAALWAAAQWVATASTTAAFVARTAIMVAASFILNAALAPSIRNNKSRDEPIGPQTTGEQGRPIQVHYGSNRIHANVVAHYTDVDVLVGNEHLWTWLLIGTDESVRKTTVTRHILACFGEGPIAPLDLTTLRINGRPLTDMPDIVCTYTRGLVDQTVLSGWESFRQDYHVGQTCALDEPITYTFNTAGWTDLQVHLGFPTGLIRMTDDGANPHSVTVKIEVGDAIADTWHTLMDGAVWGKSYSALRVPFSISGSYTGGTPFTLTAGMVPRVRVTMTAGPSSNVRVLSETEFAAVQVGCPTGFTHPGMVMMTLAGVPNEVTLGGINELSVESTGRIVDDGEGTFAVTQSHADVVRDIITGPVIEGDGSVGSPYSATYYRGSDPSRLVGTGWDAQKTLADITVPNGLGGTEKLLQCDAVFDSETSVHSAVGSICGTGRCGLDYRGRYLGLWVETSRTPVGLLCDGTWEQGSASLEPVPHKNLAAEASVRFRDGDAAFRDRTIHLIDHEFDSLTEVSLDLPAVTRTSDAARTARRELARNRLTDIAMSCRTDIYGAVYEPGDVLYGQIDGRSIGGRLTAVDGRTVTFDRSITEVVTGDDVLIVQVRDPTTGVQSAELHPVATVDSATQVTISEDWTITPSVKDPFLFGADDIEADQFEVIAVSLDSHLHASLSLVRYVPALDDLDSVAPGVRIPISTMQPVNYYGGIRPKPPADNRDDQLAGNTSGLVGDGVADETETLQDMIDDVLVNGKAMILPRGEFLITDTLVVGDGTNPVTGFTLRAAGWDQAKIVWGGPVASPILTSVGDNGDGTVRFTTDGNHGLPTGTTRLTISGTDNYDGSYTATKVGATTFDVTHAYTAETLGAGHTWSRLMISLVGCSGTTIEGIFLDGDNIAGVTALHQTSGTEAGTSSQFTTIRNCGIIYCDAVGYHVEQVSGKTTDYVTIQNCLIGYNGVNVKVEGGVRQVNIYGGANVAAATYGLLVVDGRVTGFDAFFGINGYDYDADTQVGSDIYLKGPIAQVQMMGGSSESLVILDGDWANDAGWSRHVTANGFYNFNQASVSDDLGGDVAIGDCINYDCARPLILSGCKLMGDVALGSRCTSVQSTATDFWNYYRQSTDADPIVGFTGNTAVVNWIGWTDSSTGQGSCTGAVFFGGGRLLVAEDGWHKGIDIRSADDTVYRRIGFSPTIPDTYYARWGWVYLNSNPTSDGPVGWICTVAGDGSAETTKATFEPFGTNLIGATVTDFARYSILPAEDAADLVDAMGLGTMAQQDADDVAITGGSVTGITDLAVADGGTGASTAAAACSALGVGAEDSPEFTAVNIGHATDTTLARASAGNLTVEGKAIYRADGTDVPVADGGTGASTAADARSNLGITSLAVLADAPTAITSNTDAVAGDSGKHYTNTGASGAIYVKLPAATAGMIFGATRTATQAFWVKAATGENFRGQTSDKYLELTSDGMTIVAKCLQTGVWDIIAAGIGSTAWMG